jgi:S-adenosylmethionine hydrolase
MRPLVTLLTDFGTADGYVGEIKGTILSRVPDACVIDITHDIQPQDIDAGRLTLARIWRRFPVRTVHLAVVDPGVGSSRRALAVESDARFLVGPDNGLLSPALLVAGARAVALDPPATAAPTFHGRDVFAPAAAELLRGIPLETLGTVVKDPVTRRTPEPKRIGDGGVLGEVIAIDRFGNAITNLVGARSGVLEVSGGTLALHRTYTDFEPGVPAAVVGSSGLIEIAVRNGSAAELLGLRRGSPLIFRQAR